MSSGVLLSVLIMVVYCVAVCCAAKPKARSGLENSPLTEVQALEGKRVLLPCKVSPPLSADDTILVLFYRGGFNTPIYSIDGRNGPVRRAQHWHDPAALGQRAYFDLTSDPPGLVLHPVIPSDRDQYRCRVDFRSSPTRNVRVNLQVIVPPKMIRIVNEQDHVVSGLIGPYPVGNSLTLGCRVKGGEPTPRVTWWSETSLLDDAIDTSEAGEVTNALTLPTLTRAHLYRVFTCKAANSNLSVPLAAAVTVDMSFPPLDVRILVAGDRAYSEGEQYKVVCESTGSRPSATITWWKNGMLMTDTRSQVYQEGNVSRSTLFLTPTLADHDKHISCRAKNPLLPSAVLEDTAKLIVYYTPRLSLAPGKNVNIHDIKEGDDVYFECGIQANPPVYRVQWFHNGEEISHNISAGVIQSNQSLVMQQVTKTSSGQYTCAAANIHGRSGSNALQLSVKFSPLCRPGQTKLYGAAKNEEVNITCSVEAHPEPSSFRWAFNSSSTLRVLGTGQVRSAGNSRSQVSYTPQRHQDYGSLFCWATNDVGVQQTPCVFHVIHASPPDPVNNCTVENISTTGVGVRCNAGWDGGLTQTFTLSVSHARAHTRGHDKKNASPRVLANTSTSPRPKFMLTGLQAGTEYVLTIMGVNNKGQSEPVRLAIVTLKDMAEKHTSPGGRGLGVTSLLGVTVGVLSSLLLMAAVAVVVALVKRRSHANKRREEVKITYNNTGSSPAGDGHHHHHNRSSSTHHLHLHHLHHPDETEDMANPDVVPVHDDHQVEISPEQQIFDHQQQQKQQQQQQQNQNQATTTAAEGGVMTREGHECLGLVPDSLAVPAHPAATTTTSTTPSLYGHHTSAHLTTLNAPAAHLTTLQTPGHLSTFHTPAQLSTFPLPQSYTPPPPPASYPHDLSFVSIGLPSTITSQDYHPAPAESYGAPPLPCLPLQRPKYMTEE